MTRDHTTQARLAEPPPTPRGRSLREVPHTSPQGELGTLRIAQEGDGRLLVVCWRQTPWDGQARPVGPPLRMSREEALALSEALRDAALAVTNGKRHS